MADSAHGWEDYDNSSGNTQNVNISKFLCPFFMIKFSISVFYYLKNWLNDVQ